MRDELGERVELCGTTDAALDLAQRSLGDEGPKGEREIDRDVDSPAQAVGPRCDRERRARRLVPRDPLVRGERPEGHARRHAEPVPVSGSRWSRA